MLMHVMPHLAQKIAKGFRNLAPLQLPVLRSGCHGFQRRVHNLLLLLLLLLRLSSRRSIGRIASLAASTARMICYTARAGWRTMLIRWLSTCSAQAVRRRRCLQGLSRLLKHLLRCNILLVAQCVRPGGYCQHSSWRCARCSCAWGR